MLKTGSYSFSKLKEVLGTKDKQATDRKLTRYGVEYSSTGWADNRTYTITHIPDPFRLYCVIKLGMSEAFLQMAGVFSQLELAMIRSRVRSGMANARAKGKQIGRPQITVDNLPSGFLRHYPAYKSGHLNISELARVCDLSRTTIYKYITLLEG